MVLLDTHVWVWSVEGDARRLGPKTRRLLARAESQGAIRVSPVTLFEITALHTHGRLQLTRTPQQWIRESLSGYGVYLAEFGADAAIDAGGIPKTALADPIDRLLVATARELDAPLVTADRQILRFASTHASVRVQDATR